MKDKGSIDTPALSESDFSPAEWSKINSLCTEYTRLQSSKSDIESDMSTIKGSIEELVRTTLEIAPDSPLPSITSSSWHAKPQSRTTSRINPNLLIEQGVEIEVIRLATETTISNFLHIEDPNKLKVKGKKNQSVSEELINIFGTD